MQYPTSAPRLATVLSPAARPTTGPRGAITTEQQLLLPFLTNPVPAKSLAHEVADAGSGMVYSPYCTIVAKKENCLCGHLKCPKSG